MDLTGGFGARSDGGGATRIESLHLGDELRQLPPDNASRFTALLELPPTQAVKLLHFTDSPSSSQAAAVTGTVDMAPPPIHSYGSMTFPSNSVLMERAARLSGETTTCSVPSNSGVKTETNSSKGVEKQNNRSGGKRKDSDKKAKTSPKKKKKNKSSEENEKLPYVHVRARRGQATDSHSLAERARREKINARMKLLQELVPGCDKIQGTALVLDEIINHVQSLQRQVEMLSMRLAAVNPRVDFNLDTILTSQNGSLMDGSFNGTAMQVAWPHQVIETEQPYHHRQLQQWHFDGLNQPAWGREENQDHGNDHNSLMVDSTDFHPNQVKTEL